MKNADENFSPAFRRWLARKLLNLKPSSSQGTTSVSWSKSFVSVFDRVFGIRMLSTDFALRSFVASLAAVAIMTLIWAGLRTDEFAAYVLEDLSIISVVIAATYIFNFLPDYISLMESRIVTGRMSGRYEVIRIPLLLLLDAVVTILIFLLLAPILAVTKKYILQFEDWVGVSLLGKESVSSPFRNIELFALYEELLTRGIFLESSEGFGSLGIYFYSTFFTSVWVWLYALAWAAVRLISLTRIGARIVIWALPIRRKPLRYVGMVVGFLACFVVWAIVFGFDVSISFPVEQDT